MSNDWVLIFKNDENGKSVFGNKNDLLNAARKGYPIRVGWSSKRQNDTTKTVEHIVNGEFLTIANNEELFIQIEPFLAQRPDLTSDTLSMTLVPVKLNWILGTNGIISSINNDLVQDTTIVNPPRPFGYSLSWFVNLPDNLITYKPESME